MSGDPENTLEAKTDIPQGSACGCDPGRSIFLVESSKMVVCSTYDAFRSQLTIDLLPVLHAVNHKTISRKHIVIQVLEVKEGDGV